MHSDKALASTTRRSELADGQRRGAAGEDACRCNCCSLRKNSCLCVWFFRNGFDDEIARVKFLDVCRGG